MTTHTDSTPLVSIVISSYNYGAYLTEAIESALNQTYASVEVIVVDDASADNSPAIIASYGNRIRSVLRSHNQGADATCNAACSVSQGQVIFLMDSDDLLYPTAVEKAIEQFRDPRVVKVHWPLSEIDASGRRTGRLVPDRPLPAGDLAEMIVHEGLCSCANPPTTGNAWSRRFLEEVLPLPKGAYVDTYLSVLACVSGVVQCIPEPQGAYRVHGANDYAGKSFDERVRRDFRHADLCCQAVITQCRKRGIDVDIQGLQRQSWYHQVYQAMQEIVELIPPGTSFILVDADTWAAGGSIAGRRAFPFLEHGGHYWGPPPSDQAAIQNLERLRQAGAAYMVFARHAFWWLDYYGGLYQYLCTNYHCIHKSDSIVIFAL